MKQWWKVGLCLAIAAILLAAWQPLYLSLLRNVSNLQFLAFVTSSNAGGLDHLAAAEAALARSIALGGDETLQPRLDMMRDRLERYSGGQAQAPPAAATPLPLSCLGEYTLRAADVDGRWAELGPKTQVALHWTSDAGAPSACPEQFVEQVVVYNLAWSAEDLNTYADPGAFGYAAGVRQDELREVTANRVESVDRHGRSATVFVLENLAEVDNVLQSQALSVQGGQEYLLSAWMRTDGDSPNAHLGLVCRGSSGEPNPVHYTVARGFHSSDWVHVVGKVHIADHLEYCRVLLLNYGPPQRAYFDEIVFACLPSSGNECGNIVQ